MIKKAIPKKGKKPIKKDGFMEDVGMMPGGKHMMPGMPMKGKGKMPMKGKKQKGK